MLRFLLWRLLGVIAALLAVALVAWFADGGPGRVLRGAPPRAVRLSISGAVELFAVPAGTLWDWRPAFSLPAPAVLVTAACVLGACLLMARWRARGRREYIRLEVEPYRTDQATADALVGMFEALHKRILQRWWRRLVSGQPGVALEVHYTVGAVADEREHREGTAPMSAWLAVACPRESRQMIEAALRAAYPNCRVRPARRSMGPPPMVLRLRKRHQFIRRVSVLDHFAQRREPPVNRLITVMGACGESAFVQIAMTPAPVLFERFARHLYKQHEAHLARARRQHVIARDRSMVDEVELRGGLDIQHRPLFFVDVRVIAAHRRVCERIASELRAHGAENSLVERGTALRHGLLGLYARRVRRGEGNPFPSVHKGVFASTELAALWQLPSIDYATVPLSRAALPLAPAPPGILRASDGQGALRDAIGPVSIHVEMRKQNTAVPGTVEQGKSSYLVATVAEDLRRERCAVIVLDPKGDAADAAISLVPAGRTCTLLDLSHPTCGFNPLAVEAPADVIADYVVGALKNLFTDADIRASSDRYLRNAIIAVLAHDRGSTLWDAARLLSVGEEGYAYRRNVGAHVRTLPEYKEISSFFTAELAAQLADARSSTTAKLDAPVNKLARLLNSPSIKRVLLNDSLRVDLDDVISREEVLVVKGALGMMGAGNTSVLMQLLVGMLDASLARQQDLRAEGSRVSVALKIDEAPLVINRGFAETIALKRSAGLETVACWQTDAQWVERELRDQLDALFAHRVYFATASAPDARAAVGLTMAEFSDTVRPGIEQLSALGHPDVRLHLPKHHAIASWTTPAGRQAPFVARTIPLRVDRERLALHAARQAERGGRHLADLRQPHWDRSLAAGDGRSAGDATPTLALDAGHVRRGAGTAREPSSDARVRATIVAGIPPESYRELVALDRAASVRWTKPADPARPLDPEPMDLDILELVSQLGHVLTSQIHRRFNPGRAATTTQRRLKRLADAGFLGRFQFHQRDGGGVPMCCLITAEGRRLLEAHGRRSANETPAERESPPRVPARAGRLLQQARRDVHVAGWVLALEGAIGESRCSLRGRSESVMSPPLRSGGEGRTVLAPSDLRLPGGFTPHDFLRTDGGGQKVEADRFETLRPDAVIEVAPATTVAGPGCPAEASSPPSRTAIAESSSVKTPLDLIVELDDRPARGAAAGKLERYDHFLAGWSAHTRRYGRRREASVLVVFVCRDRARARDCARAADSALRACRAYAGEYPINWEYPGRAGIVFAAERDMHDGLMHAYGVPALPPTVRVEARDDPGAAEAGAEVRNILALASRES